MTELAQQCIEREIQQRTGYLDLGRCGLTQMPDLSGLHWLHTLILSNEWLDWEQRKWINSLNRIEETTRSTEINTNLIRSNQEVHSRHLQSLLHFAGQHEAALKGVFEKIDALPEMESADLARIDDLLERHFGALLERLPTSHEIVGEWKKATAKSPDEVDMKWKLKFKLPLIFAEVEKELSWDGKKMLNSIRQEITAFAGGEKPFRALFLED